MSAQTAATIAAIAAVLAVMVSVFGLMVGVLNVFLTSWLDAQTTRQCSRREHLRPLVVAVEAASLRHEAASYQVLALRRLGVAEDSLTALESLRRRYTTN